MSGGLHLSVRVPWHDTGWSGTVCADPVGNASCVLLKNVGDKRDDDYEATHAGKSLDLVNPSRVACVAERATFLSPDSYLLEKTHPYAFNPALRNKILRTGVTVPAYGVHATPYYWLHRDNVDHVQRIADVDFRPELEDLVDRTLGFRPQWVIHGDNQRALMGRFFQEVQPHHNLLFFYLKHSPFTSASSSASRALLVGAARITDVELAGPWRTTGDTPFPNHMWESSVRHSLRPDGTGGVVLPLPALARLDLDPEDLEQALAWAPEYGGREFAYATEHVSDDSAIAALERLYQAAQGCRRLGLEVPDASLDWVSERIDELWVMRGPSPGLGAALEAVAVPHGPVVAREVARVTADGVDPWETFEAAVTDPDNAPPELAKRLGGTVRKVWRALSATERATLRLLARFNLTVEQAGALFEGATEIELTHEELLADPYHAFTCLLGGRTPVAFEVIDRGCFPEPGLREKFPLPEPSAMTDATDFRRVQALLTAVVEDAAARGDTVLPLTHALRIVDAAGLTTPCPLSERLLEALELHPSQLEYDPESPYWPPLCPATLADGAPAYKLTRLETIAQVIRSFVDRQVGRDRHQAPTDLRQRLDQLLGQQPPAGQADQPTDGADADADAQAEELARQEKAAALAELFAAPVSVLNGRAGTGKTTLVRALAEHERVKPGGVLLLAPTGKARVQLTTKVGLPAHTVAQFLGRYGRYDRDTGAYLVGAERPKAPRVGTVVVDEASMLTEEQLAALLDALPAPDRLILVGDPRQLPPIGAGRPFVDLISRLTEAAPPPGFPRVSPGYAELTVLRRQSGQVRDDLALAAWFAGDEIPDGFEDVWDRLRTGTPMASLAAVPWRSGRPDSAVDQVLAQELDVAGPQASAQFELSYGGRRDGPWIKFGTGADGAGQRCESWQILSPTRTHPWGTVEVNRRLKRKHRARALRDALRPPYERRVPAPLGPEQIVLGDKVLNNLNSSRTGYRICAEPLNYVANGEIGVVVGQVGRSKGAAPRYTNIEFSSQVGVTYGYRKDNEDNPSLELAWAITVHKAQGSEFEKVFLLLPASSRRLSRELLYTALTRQKEKVVLLHEGPIDDLFQLTRSTRSETARRLTDLFTAPAPRPVLLPDGTEAGELDGNLVHVTASGVLVRGANEVVIAGILDTLAPGAWEYERPLTLGGETRFPDFTAHRDGGGPVYWEHTAMITNPAYREAWERKKQWYARHGVLPHDQGGGPAGTLICTHDGDGLGVAGWTALAERVIGAPAKTFSAPTKKVAKKAAPAARPRPS